MIKGIKTKLALTMATTALGATLLAGGSFALFTSTTTNAGNTFTAGTVVVTDTTSGTLASQEVNFGNIAPGDTKTLSMTVKNTGTLEQWVKIDSDATNISKKGSLFAGATPVILTLDTKVVKLAPNQTATFDVTYEFPRGADNSYQSAAGAFNVVVDAVQYRNNTIWSPGNTSEKPLSW
jgi:spore coat-associated protein N